MTPNELEIGVPTSGLRSPIRPACFTICWPTSWRLSSDLDVNYMLVAEKAE